MQRLAIIVTKPPDATNVSSSESRLPFAETVYHLLSQLAHARVDKTVILALESAAGVERNFCRMLYDMQLSLRVVAAPNDGRLIDAVTVEEIDEVNRDVLVITDNLNIEFSLIYRLVQSCEGNLILAGKAHQHGSFRIATNRSLRLTATVPNCCEDENFSDLSPLGLYKFEPAFLRSIARRRPHRSNDDLEFFEAALGLPTHEMHIVHGGTVLRKTANGPTMMLTSDDVETTAALPRQTHSPFLNTPFRFLDLELDVKNYQVRRSGRRVHLTPTAFRLLHHFMKEPRKVCSRDELRNAAWSAAIHVGPRTVDVHIGHLRAALNEFGERKFIRTVRSVGYALGE